MTEYTVTGITVSGGKKYVQIHTPEQIVSLPIETFHQSATQIKGALAQHSVPIFQPQTFKRLIADIEALNYFPQIRAATKSGWDKKAFALLDGSIIDAQNNAAPLILFRRKNGACGKSGSRLSGKKFSKERVIDNDLAAFAMVVPLMPALLPFMPHVPSAALEFVSNDRAARELLIRLATSTIAGAAACETYPTTMEAFVSDPRFTRELHRHHPIIIRDADLTIATADQRKRLTIFHSLIDCARHGGVGNQWEVQSRNLVIFAVDQAIRNRITGINGLDDGIISIQMPDGWPRAEIEKLRAANVNGASYIEELVAGVTADGGHSFYRLVLKISKNLCKQGVHGINALDQWQDEFLCSLGDTLTGRDRQIARWFAGVYATAMAAQGCYAIPQDTNYLAIVQTAYHAWKSGQKSMTPFADRLLAVLKRDDVIDLRDDHRDIDTDTINASIGTVRRSKDGHDILRIKMKSIKSAFPDWDYLEKMDDVRAAMRNHISKNERSLAPKTSIAKGMKSQRAYCFNLPSSVASES